MNIYGFRLIRQLSGLMNLVMGRGVTWCPLRVKRTNVLLRSCTVWTTVAVGLYEGSTEIAPRRTDLTRTLLSCLNRRLVRIRPSFLHQHSTPRTRRRACTNTTHSTACLLHGRRLAATQRPVEQAHSTSNLDRFPDERSHPLRSRRW